MTLPDERTRAVIRARRLLCRIIAPGGLRSPRSVREEALNILRHFPGVVELSQAGAAAPNVFDETEAWKAAADDK